MSSLKKLPLGVQALETFKRDNCLYVDKTKNPVSPRQGVPLSY